MSVLRRSTAAAVALTLALATVPARAGDAPPPSPDGVRTLMRYLGCTISVIAMHDMLSFTSALVTCSRLMLEETERDAAR
jgi:hypothetical protein